MWHACVCLCVGVYGVILSFQYEAEDQKAEMMMAEIYRKKTEKEGNPPLAFYGGDEQQEEEEEGEGAVNELLAETEEVVMEQLEEKEITDDGFDYEWNVDTTWQDNGRGESDDGQDKEEALYEWNMETRPAEPKPVDYTPYENAYNHHGNGYNYHGDPITMDPVSSYYDDSWYNYRYYHHARSHRVYWGILGGFAGLIVMVTVGAAAAFFYQKRVSPLLM